MKMGVGMKEGKSLVGITLGSNKKITPEIIWGYFYFNIRFFLGGGMVLNFQKLTMNHDIVKNGQFLHIRQYKLILPTHLV